MYMMVHGRFIWRRLRSASRAAGLRIGHSCNRRAGPPWRRWETGRQIKCCERAGLLCVIQLNPPAVPHEIVRRNTFSSRARHAFQTTGACVQVSEKRSSRAETMARKPSAWRGRRQRRFPWFVALVGIGYAALVCLGMAPVPFLPAFGAANGGGLAKISSGTFVVPATHLHSCGN